MFLTVADAARIANVSESTVRGWISAGKLPVTQPIGPRHLIRVDEDHLAAFLAAGLRGGPWR
jgi:excisionase family DNA binding protein